MSLYYYYYYYYYYCNYYYYYSSSCVLVPRNIHRDLQIHLDLITYRKVHASDSDKNRTKNIHLILLFLTT